MAVKQQLPEEEQATGRIKGGGCVLLDMRESAKVLGGRSPEAGRSLMGALDPQQNGLRLLLEEGAIKYRYTNA